MTLIRATTGRNPVEYALVAVILVVWSLCFAGWWKYQPMVVPVSQASSIPHQSEKNFAAQQSVPNYFEDEDKPLGPSRGNITFDNKYE